MGKFKPVYVTLGAEKNAVAYCRKHHQKMTSKQMKKKQCLSKNCNHLDRIPGEYWKDRVEKNRSKKQARAEREAAYLNAIGRSQDAEQLREEGQA